MLSFHVAFQGEWVGVECNEIRAIGVIRGRLFWCYGGGCDLNLIYVHSGPASYAVQRSPFIPHPSSLISPLGTLVARFL